MLLSGPSALSCCSIVLTSEKYDVPMTDSDVWVHRCLSQTGGRSIGLNAGLVDQGAPSCHLASQHSVRSRSVGQSALQAYVA